MKAWKVLFLLLVTSSIAAVNYAPHRRKAFHGEVNAGPIGWWKFDDASGTTANDSSGNGLNGVFMGSGTAPTWVAGKLSGAIQLNNGQYVGIPYSSSCDVGTGDFTVAFFYRTSNGGLNECPFSKDEGSGQGIVIYASTALAVFVADGARHTATTTINDDAWHHVALLRRAGIVELYVDGALELTYASPATINLSGSTPLRWGMEDTVDYAGLGKLDDARFYSRALSTAEILTLANQ